MKSTKKLLLHSALALILCISVLIGTTFAWFTDSVTSGSNIIKSGNLDIEMYWTEDPTTGWNNVEEDGYKTIFSYDNWEPGYTEVKYIKLVNNGSLALNYQLAITPEAEVGKLAEVIQVYYENGEAQLSDRDDVTNMNSLGFLNNVLNGGSVVAGTLMAEGQVHTTNPIKETVITIAMNMITSAGNDYQSETAGEFSITAVATQAMHEQDSFGSDYDANAKFPPVLRGTSVSAPVENNNGVVAQPVTLAGNGLSVYVPAGVALKDGATTLTASTKVKDSSATGIVPVNNEKLLPLDVHVDVAEDNQIPLIIDFGVIMPKNLNMGNYTLIHVEDGVNVAMTKVDSKAELDSHNEFYYDSTTGELSVAMKSFSPLELLVDMDKPWSGDYTEADTKFAGSGTAEDPYIIGNADELAGLGELISYDSANYGNKHYKLISDININGEETIWYPIGYHKKGEGANGAAKEETWYEFGGRFTGVFDGAGHTVTGIRQNTWAMDGNYGAGYWKAAMGLFGCVTNGTVKNLVIDDFYSEGEFAPTGCVTAYADGKCTFENITVLNSHPQTYNTGVSCIVGWDSCPGGDANDKSKWSQFTFKNITIDDSNTVSALWGSWDVAAAGILGSLDTESSADFENCYVSATIDVYNDVCGNYQYYWYRYTGAYIGTVYKKDANNANKISLKNVSAKNCYADFGDRHEYYYCEFVKNSLASYTHDHQMSRISHSDLIFTDENNNGNCDWKERETVKGCQNHNHETPGYESKDINGDGIVDSDVLLEDKQAIYIPFRQLFGGYGWGTDGVDFDEYELKGQMEIADVTTAEQKFEDNVLRPGVEEDNAYLYVKNEAYPLHNFFKAVKDAKINLSNIQITISPIGDSKASGELAFDKNDWTQSNITFGENTGYLQIIISDYTMCKPTSIVVEVVDELSGSDDGWWDTDN